MDPHSNWLWIMISVVMGLCLAVEVAGFVLRITGRW